MIEFMKDGVWHIFNTIDSYIRFMENEGVCFDEGPDDLIFE